MVLGSATAATSSRTDKDYQPGATFRSDFRNVRIGAGKAEVQPYYRD
ncbi:hypothetical protein [Promicromonospora sp. NPDC019610]